jgi:O-methyltransferase
MSLSKFIFHKTSSALSKNNLYFTKSLVFRKKPQALPINFDYIRYSTLGLCYEEICSKNVIGNVAELGVYKGDFAKRLNFLFSDRKIYLFDTFKGFDKNDIQIEHQSDFSKGNQDFSNTSVDLVMQKMPYPENCIIKKGTFPQTTNGILDSFCFVSLDADLYEPILQGLIFFYPKLEKGGYIFVHDFNNEEYKGSRQSVLKFCSDNNIGYIPIPDSGGTVIITK